MPQLVFATGNPNKVREVRELLAGTDFTVVSMRELGVTEDIPETEPTLAGNALLKARYLHQNYGYDCFSEDTGLEIDALGGAPGVTTARFAGPNATAADNIAKTLREMDGKTERAARFRTVMALILNGEEHLFHGVCEGTITERPSGTDGFGYDPIFRPEGFDRTFAQTTKAEKNTVSHRGRALRGLIAFLQDH